MHSISSVHFLPILNTISPHATNSNFNNTKHSRHIYEMKTEVQTLISSYNLSFPKNFGRSWNEYNSIQNLHLSTPPHKSPDTETTSLVAETVYFSHVILNSLMIQYTKSLLQYTKVPPQILALEVRSKDNTTVLSPVLPVHQSTQCRTCHPIFLAATVRLIVLEMQVLILDSLWRERTLPAKP